MGGNIDYLEEDLSPIATADLDVNKEPSFKKRQILNFLLRCLHCSSIQGISIFATGSLGNIMPIFLASPNASSSPLSELDLLY